LSECPTGSKYWNNLIIDINLFISSTIGVTGNAYLGGTEDMSDGCRGFILTIENTNIDFVSLTREEGRSCSFTKKDCHAPFDSDEEIESRSITEYEEVKIMLYDLSGRLIYKSTDYISGTSLNQEINLIESIPSNLYVVKINSNNGYRSELIFKN